MNKTALNALAADLANLPEDHFDPDYYFQIKGMDAHLLGVMTPRQIEHHEGWTMCVAGRALALAYPDTPIDDMPGGGYGMSARELLGLSEEEARKLFRFHWRSTATAAQEVAAVAGQTRVGRLLRRLGIGSRQFLELT